MSRWSKSVLGMCACLLASMDLSAADVTATVNADVDWSAIAWDSNANPTEDSWVELTVANGATLTIDEVISVSGLNIVCDGGSCTVAFTADGGYAGSLSVPSGTTVTLKAAESFTEASPLELSGQITNHGTFITKGHLYLSAANVTTGILTVEEGSLKFNSAQKAISGVLNIETDATYISAQISDAPTHNTTQSLTVNVRGVLNLAATRWWCVPQAVTINLYGGANVIGDGQSPYGAVDSSRTVDQSNPFIHVCYDTNNEKTSVAFDAKFRLNASRVIEVDAGMTLNLTSELRNETKYHQRLNLIGGGIVNFSGKMTNTGTGYISFAVCDGMTLGGAASIDQLELTGEATLAVKSTDYFTATRYSVDYMDGFTMLNVKVPEGAQAGDIVLGKSGSVTHTLPAAYRIYVGDSTTPFTTLALTVSNGNIVLAEAQGLETESALRISEIMPKGGAANLDPNRLESGWVEVQNTSDKWVDLKDYRFIRINRCKEVKKKGCGNFPSYLIPPRGRFVFYTSECYPNGKGFMEDDEKCGLFATKDPDGAVPKFYDYGTNVLVWPDKVNPKKFPFVRLYHAPEGGDVTPIDTVVIPSDLPEDASILVGDATEDQSTLRWICPTPTKGTANPSTDGLTRLGPNVGPLYDFTYNSGDKKKYVASEFEMKNLTPPATVGAAYRVTLPINSVMAPRGTEANPKDAITAVKLIYRKGFGTDTVVSGEVAMTSAGVGDYNWGALYTAEIPADFITEADKGKLIQWKVEITDASETTWISPSFNNKDDGYEWYGTIVSSPELNSAKLPTWHLFADAASVEQMDIDTDDQDLTKVPHNARVAIYDASTSTYYDYVRIDLRGNTSAKFTKKSHGLRFAKAHPLTMADAVRGGEVEEVRKSSLIGEFGDPSRMRQMVAFWLFDKMGNKTPFDFPVRCNLNGEFFQLAFHSERFTDELIEDFYGLDKYGYGYKNAGSLRSNSGTVSGDIEKKTPDDGNESDISVL